MSKYLERYEDGQKISEYRIEAEIYSPKKVSWIKVNGGAEAVVAGKVLCRITHDHQKNIYNLTCVDKTTNEFFESDYLTDVAAQYECLGWLQKHLFVEKPCPKESCTGMIVLETRDGILKVFSPERSNSCEIWEGHGFEIWHCNRCDSNFFDISEFNINKLPKE